MTSNLKLCDLPENDLVKDDVDRPEAEKAVETLLKWIGEDIHRDGIKDTPSRVTKAYTEMFSGYNEDPAKVLDCQFTETAKYNDIILVNDIRFYSYCEHHIMPIIGTAHVAYIPRHNVVGISKIVRVVEIFAKRMQIQERLTAQIAQAIQEHISPIGTAVVLEAEHLCMTSRGIQKPGTKLKTKTFLGAFADDKTKQDEFFSLLRMNKG